jgi:hypothetical protein
LLALYRPFPIPINIDLLHRLFASNKVLSLSSGMLDQEPQPTNKGTLSMFPSDLFIVKGWAICVQITIHLSNYTSSRADHLKKSKERSR